MVNVSIVNRVFFYHKDARLVNVSTFRQSFFNRKDSRLVNVSTLDRAFLIARTHAWSMCQLLDRVFYHKDARLINVSFINKIFNHKEARWVDVLQLVSLHGEGWPEPYMCGVYIRHFWQGNHQIYSHIRRVYTILASPKQGTVSTVGTCPSAFVRSCLLRPEV